MRLQLTVSSLAVARDITATLIAWDLPASAHSTSDAAWVDVVAPDVATAGDVRRVAARMDHPAHRLAVA